MGPLTGGLQFPPSVLPVLIDSFVDKQSLCPGISQELSASLQTAVLSPFRGHQKPAKVDQTESAEGTTGVIYARRVCVSTALWILLGSLSIPTG